QYAAEQLLQVGGEAKTAHLRQLHAEYYLQLCLEAAPDLEGHQQGAWLKRLDLEHDNLLGTFNTLTTQPGRTPGGLALGVALYRFVRTRRDARIFLYFHDALSRATGVPLALRARTLVALSNLTR